MPIEPNDVVLNKVAIIERAINRALEEYKKDIKLSNFTEQDAHILNLVRACQAAIDLAMHIVSEKKWGLPQSSSDSFRLLESKSMIQGETAKSLISMVGFRNIAIHEYQKLNIDIIHQIMKKEYHVFQNFCQELGFNIKLS